MRISFCDGAVIGAGGTWHLAGNAGDRLFAWLAIEPDGPDGFRLRTRPVRVEDTETAIDATISNARRDLRDDLDAHLGPGSRELLPASRGRDHLALPECEVDLVEMTSVARNAEAIALDDPEHALAVLASVRRELSAAARHARPGGYLFPHAEPLKRMTAAIEARLATVGAAFATAVAGDPDSPAERRARADEVAAELVSAGHLSRLPESWLQLSPDAAELERRWGRIRTDLSLTEGQRRRLATVRNERGAQLRPPDEPEGRVTLPPRAVRRPRRPTMIATLAGALLGASGVVAAVGASMAEPPDPGFAQKVGFSRGSELRRSLDAPVFNSIVDQRLGGSPADERKFLSISVLRPERIPANPSARVDRVHVRPGDVVSFAMYVNNNALGPFDMIGKRTAIARNARALLDWPDEEVGPRLEVRAYAYADNLLVDERHPEWHTVGAKATLVSQSGKPIRLGFTRGSVKLLQHRSPDRRGRLGIWQGFDLTKKQTAWLFTGTPTPVGDHVEMSPTSGISIGHDGRFTPAGAVAHNQAEALELFPGDAHRVQILLRGQVLDAAAEAPRVAAPAALDTLAAVALHSGPGAPTSYHQEVAVAPRSVVELAFVVRNVERAGGTAAAGARIEFEIPKRPVPSLHSTMRVVSENGTSQAPYRAAGRVLLRSRDGRPLTLTNFRAARVRPNRGRGDRGPFLWDSGRELALSRQELLDHGDRYVLVLRPFRGDRLRPGDRHAVKLSVLADVAQ